MFCIKEYTRYGIDYYFCRTIEKAKETFDRVFWEWVKNQTDNNWSDDPKDYDCETWEELLQGCWENGGLDDVISCEPIICEEDKS